MESIPFLSQLLLILLVSSVAGLIFEKLRLPSILGFLFAGIALGPSGFGLVADTEEIHYLAELGVALLLLTIGLEFSFERLKGLRNLAIIGGGLQMLLSTVLAVALCWKNGWPASTALVLGSVIALSSTAIVLKYLVDRGELDTQHGRIAVAILIFQDIAVVPILIIINSFAPGEGDPTGRLALLGVKFLVLTLSVFLFSKFILDGLLKKVTLTRNREMFFLSSAVICLGTAWLAEHLGMSFAIGAFFAGLMFANTEYGPQLMGDIVPFRDLFVSIFFVSIGLLFSLRFALDNAGFLILVVLIILVVNFILIAGLTMGFGYPPRVALSAGLILSQIGEFSFIILESARSAALIDSFVYQLLISAAFLTMFLTPFLFKLIPYVFRFTSSPKALGLPPSEWRRLEDKIESLKGHVILCGYGAMGRDLCQTMTEEKIPFVLVDMDPAKTKAAREEGFSVIYGDAANMEVLNRAGISKAKAVVISFGDPVGRDQIVRVVERLNPKVHLSARARSEKEAPALFELGVDHVVVEEWESNYEIHRDVLNQYKISPERIRERVHQIQAKKELIVETAILDSIKNSPK